MRVVNKVQERHRAGDADACSCGAQVVGGSVALDLVLFLAAAWHVMTHEVLGFAAFGIAASTLDDVVIDLLYLWLVVCRQTRPRPLPALASEAGWMAIIVPAWDEADVIAAMLTDLTQHLDYRRYRVFVGVYPNDPATRREVERVGDVRVIAVNCTHDGPTTKADCLNHLWRALVDYEANAGMRFKAVVLHDAEDVVDPAELRVFDAYLPEFAMIQLPVRPLIDRDSRWISGHYLDEFAEAHHKDIVVRAALGAAVPSAGVGCAVDRTILGRLAGPAAAPFDPASMTEDYEMGMRIAALGGRGLLLKVRTASRTIATREHFPATFEAAVRQKTRWLLGIALDGWDRLGWRSSFADRYMLLRDRKAIVAPLLVGLGYAVVILWGIDAVVAFVFPAARAFPSLAPRGSLVADLLVANTAALGWRLAARAVFTGYTHGWREGLRAVPRTVVANWINAAAAIGALRRYRRIRAGRELPRWDKTAHRFPDGDRMLR